MALQTCRIGNIPNAIQWDDAVHTGAIETTEVIKAGNPIVANDVVTLATLGTSVISAAVITDHAIVRGDGGARGVQDSLVTIDDAGNISLAALATVDGVDISVHAGNVNAHHAQSHNAVSHSDIASSGANIDDAVGKKHAQGTDTALGGVGTKNPPIDADKVIYRDSAAADVLVTSTWTQIKAFLRTYLDTIYHILGGDLGTPSAAVLTNATGLPVATGIVAGAVDLKLFTNAAGTAPEWAGGIYTGATTIDTATATGTQAITGVGFKPSAIVFIATVYTTQQMSIGFATALTDNCIYNEPDDTWSPSSASLMLVQSAGVYYLGTISAWGADGFTISWTKAGAKTGTANIYFLAFR